MLKNKEYWKIILENEDRLIKNSDRRFRYHCYSLESMSEELTYKERALQQEDAMIVLLLDDFLDTIQNEKLAYGLSCLTDRQRQMIELHFWQGYQYKEIAFIFGCDPSAVSHMMKNVLKRLRICMLDK